MEREYLQYVDEACRNGLSALEVQNYFNEVLKANNKKSKEFLKVTAIGISRAKKKAKNMEQSQNQREQTIPAQNIQENGYEYQYFKQ